MAWIVGGAIAGGALLGAVASDSAAGAQAGAAHGATDAQLAMYNTSRADMEPWKVAGQNSLNHMLYLMGIETPGGVTKAPGDETYWGSLTKPFSMKDYQEDPGYGFRLKEGMKALEHSASAKGNLLSGGMMKGISRYSQDYASNEYANAYNRYNQNQANLFNRYAAISGVGQTTAQQTGAMGVQTGANVGNSMMAAGNARASGYIGGANAISGGVSSGLGYYQQNQLLNKLFPQQQPTGYSFTGDV